MDFRLLVWFHGFLFVGSYFDFDLVVGGFSFGFGFSGCSAW